MSIIVRKAKEQDLLMLQKLLAKAGVREAGIAEHVEHFLVVTDGANRIIGTVGIEKYEESGLLRSLVLDSTIWTARLSLEFLEVALHYAKEQNISSIYLCSKGTNALFHELGFRPINLEDVPFPIRKSSHFRDNVKKDTRVWTCAL